MVSPGTFRMQLKPKPNRDSHPTLEKKSFRTFRKQEGFQGRSGPSSIPGGNGKAIGCSFWQSKENAEAYP